MIQRHSFFASLLIVSCLFSVVVSFEIHNCCSLSRKSLRPFLSLSPFTPSIGNKLSSFALGSLNPACKFCCCVGVMARATAAAAASVDGGPGRIVAFPETSSAPAAAVVAADTTACGFNATKQSEKARQSSAMGNNRTKIRMPCLGRIMMRFPRRITTVSGQMLTRKRKRRTTMQPA